MSLNTTGTQLFLQPFTEGASGFPESWMWNNNTGPGSTSGVISTEQFHSSPSSAKTIISGGKAGVRMAWYPAGRIFPKQFFWEGKFYLPQAPTTARFMNIMQLKQRHQPLSSGSDPFWVLYPRPANGWGQGGTLRLVIRHDRYWFGGSSGPNTLLEVPTDNVTDLVIPTGSWFKLKVRVHRNDFQSDGVTEIKNGRFSVWLNTDSANNFPDGSDQLACDYQNIATVYKWAKAYSPWRNMLDSNGDPHHICYINNYSENYQPDPFTVFLEDFAVYEVAQEFPPSGGTDVINPPSGIPIVSVISVTDNSALINYVYNQGDASAFQYRINSGTAITVSSTPFTVSSLMASTQYNVEVRAINSAGEGAWSSQVSFITQSGDSPPPPPPPTGDTIAVRINGKLSLSENNSFDYNLDFDLN